MAIVITDRVSAATMCDAFVDRIDIGGAGSLELYDGAVPLATTDSVANATLLATFTLANPAFGDANTLSAQAVANAVTPVLAVANGSPDFALVRDGDGDAIAVVDVGDEQSDAAVKLNTTSIFVGGQLTVVSFKITHPTGAS